MKIQIIKCVPLIIYVKIRININYHQMVNNVYHNVHIKHMLIFMNNKLITKHNIIVQNNVKKVIIGIQINNKLNIVQNNVLKNIKLQNI